MSWIVCQYSSTDCGQWLRKWDRILYYHYFALMFRKKFMKAVKIRKKLCWEQNVNGVNAQSLLATCFSTNHFLLSVTRVTVGVVPIQLTAYIKPSDTSGRWCEAADNVWSPAGTCWCSEGAVSEEAPVIYWVSAEWNQLREHLVMLNESVFIIRWQASLRATGDKVEFIYKHTGCWEKLVWRHAWMTAHLKKKNASFFFCTLFTDISFYPIITPGAVMTCAQVFQSSSLSEVLCVSVCVCTHRLVVVSSDVAVTELFKGWTDPQIHYWSRRVTESAFQLNNNKRHFININSQRD